MEERLLAARWVQDFARPLYGPGGGHVLIDGDPPLVVRGASAMREAGTAHPAARPYVELVRAIHTHAGDQATMAALLAAAIVAAGHERPIHMLDALPLARRQVLGTVSACAQAATPEQALESVVPGWQGIAKVPGHVDLDEVEIRAEDRDAPAWEAGVLISEKGPRPAGRVLVCDGFARKMQVTSRDPAGQRALEEQFIRDVCQRVKDLGVGLVICAGNHDVVEALRTHVLVVPEAPKRLQEAVCRITGAARVHRFMDADASDVGAFTPERHQDGWVLRGLRPGWTLLVPSVGPARESAIDSAEKVLRAMGVVVPDPRALPGGGRWQRRVAASLRAAADHGPGKTPLGLRAIADAFDDLADQLVRNMGRDPTRDRLLHEMQDPAACVEMALDAAFQAAKQILRVDARHTRRPSSQEQLRGGTGPVGSPKGMPGDIPPLM